MRTLGLIVAPLLFVASTLAGPAAAQTRAKGPPAPVAHGAQLPDPSGAGVVNLNAASPGELELLPGIGPAKARAICEHRKQHPFKKVDDVVKVKGIGRKTFATLRPYLAVEGPTTLRAPPRKK